MLAVLVVIVSLILAGSMVAVYFLYVNKGKTEEDKKKRLSNVKMAMMVVGLLIAVLGGGRFILPLLLMNQM